MDERRNGGWGERLERLRAGWAAYVESYERRNLAEWEEDLLHWGRDGALHGSLTPPSARRSSTTRTGWCRGLAAQH